MNKLIQTAGFVFALATTSALAGCELYFDGHNGDNGDRWNYCGSDGYYTCQGQDCTWVGSTCPTDGGSGSGNPTGGACSVNTDCAAGCYCASGTCEEGGFCTTDTDCGDGYHCDTNRNSCEPNTNPTCGSNADCANGTVCDPSTNTCTSTCSCGSDEVAKANGYDYCDETRQTCMKGSDPVGDCAGTLTCTTTPPICDEHMVPGIFAGCYTGACRAIASCEAAPTCTALTHEDDCLDRTVDCSATYTGNNCRKADGSACHAGDSGCTCESFTFSRCDAHSTAAKVFENGTDATTQVNASYLRN